MKSYINECFEITGDPPTDIGGFGLKYFSEKNPELDLIGLIKKAAKIYVYDWNAGINTFFLNSKITQPAFKGEVKFNETIDYFQKLLDDKILHKEGICRITGKEGKLFAVGREAFILSGSGTFINFHHGFEGGMYVSKEAIIRNFFLPIAALYLGDKIALIFSNHSELTEYFAVKNVEQNLKNIATGISKGVLKSEFSNPANALFEFAEQCIDIAQDRVYDDNISLNLYHFTNFGAGPTVDLYYFPSNLFEFYKRCLSAAFKSDWMKFIRAHYKPNSTFKNPRFNKENHSFEVEVKKNKEAIDYAQYKIWYNKVYDALLKGNSILPYILSWSKSNVFNWSIVTYYQKTVRNMNAKTLQKIEEIAEFIIQDEDALKRNLSRINGFKRSNEIRSFLISQVTKNYSQGNKEPLITLQDYVEYLFPDGSYWSEIRNLLLISIYQKLHLKNIQVDVESTELEDVLDEPSNI